MHPAIVEMLENFEFEHLPPRLAAVSERYHSMAHQLVEEFELEGPELTVGLRKLLESKDCAVRAMVQKIKREERA